MKYLIIPILLLLTACERYQDVEVEVPYKPKPVVVCMLGSGLNRVAVSVTKSTPVFGSEINYQSSPKYITDARISLVGDQQEWGFAYDADLSLYYADLGNDAIQTGKRYTLRVMAENQVLEGSVVVPPPVNKNINISRETFFDDSGTLQFHRVRITYTGDGSEWYEAAYPYLIYPDSNRFLMSEENNDRGASRKLEAGETITRSFLSTVALPGYDPVGLALNMWNCDNGFGRNESQSSYLVGNSGFPFGETGITFSNMKGPGIGVLGSYNPATTYYFWF
jgi:Domain of unknown function (DUF4249)